METKMFFDPRTNTLTYVVYDPKTKDAVVIDPVLDYDALRVRMYRESVDAVAGFIEKEKLALRWVLETHAHADHISGSQVLKERFGAKVAIGEHITKVQQVFQKVFDLPASFRTDGSQFDRLLKDGETLVAGSLEIGVIHTPGHTPACVTYRIDDAIFTGDALFMPDYGTGRCDFPAGSAEDLYRSVRKLYELPDETIVYVGHDYQPGGRVLEYKTTIGASKAKNLQLRADTRQEDYVAFRKTRDATLAPPVLLFPSVQLNIDAGKLPPPAPNGRRYLKLPIGLFD